jgi:CRP-like cAMP-binding protein
MSTNTAQLLAEIPLFSTMDDEERRQLRAIMRERSFQPGQVVMAASDPEASFLIIEQGEMEVWLTDTDGKKVVLEVLGPGKVFGDLFMLSGKTRSANATTSGELVTLELGREAFFDFLRRRPDTAIDVLVELGQRLKDTDNILRTRVSRNANEEHDETISLGQRVADIIADFSGSLAFLLLNLAVFVVWIVANTVGSSHTFSGKPKTICMQPLIYCYGSCAIGTYNKGLTTFTIGAANGNADLFFNNRDNIIQKLDRARSQAPDGISMIGCYIGGDKPIAIKVSEKEGRGQIHG